jgi:ribonucleoside-diphosphate reductase alpha chain
MKPQERPGTLNSKTICIPTGLGKLYLTISYHNNKPFEIFCTIGKSGREVTAMTEGISRMISLWLRSGGSIKEVVDQLKGIGGESPLPTGDKIILSVPDAIGQYLELEMKNEKSSTNNS